MIVGMMWLMDDPTDLAGEIERALEYFKKKYGYAANHCVFNSGVLLPELPIGTSQQRWILPRSVWIGTSD